MMATTSDRKPGTRARADVPKHLDLYYDGGWHKPKSGNYVETIDPSTGKGIAKVAHAGADDADAAIEAAHKAFQT